MEGKQLAFVAAKFADDKKANDIHILTMQGLTIVTDYFVIASGDSTIQVKAICDNIENELAKENVKLLHKEGADTGEWVLMDYGDVVVHVFLRSVRDFYNLETLWADAPMEVYVGE